MQCVQRIKSDWEATGKPPGSHWEATGVRLGSHWDATGKAPRGTGKPLGNRSGSPSAFPVASQLLPSGATGKPALASHVQPIAWRRPDQGLNPQLRVPLRARRRAPRQREWYPCRSLSTAATKMWTSKAWFNQPSFEKKSCPTRPTVTRNHKLHGRHEKSPTNLQVEQYNRIRGGELSKERGMQRRLANADS